MKLKKSVAFIMMIILLLSVSGVSAYATDESRSFEISIEADKNDTLNAGDEITVSCTIRRTDKDEPWQMYAWQTEISFDNSAFELVQDSAVPSSGVGSSIHPGVMLDKVYFNSYSFSASGDEYPSELKVGSFVLRAKKSCGGDYAVKNTNYHISTKGGKDHYAVKSKDLSINVKGDPSLSAERYRDVPSDAWYKNAVSFAVGHGLFNGTDENTFSPGASMTRAMLVTVLWRLEGSPKSGSESGFNDVKGGTWYTDAVTWASDNGIVTGYAENVFGTNDNVTRQQMAAILYRYAASKGYAGSVSSALAGYSDNAEIASWANGAMSWANAAGLITGRTETTLVPNGTANRAEVATIFMRFCENIIGG